MPHTSNAPREFLIVLRHGETFIKGDNRRQFEDVLRANVTRALRPIVSGDEALTVERGQGRFFVRCPEAKLSEALERLRWVFGLTSLSPATLVPRDVEGITQIALTLAEEARERTAPRTFRVTTQRADKSFPLTSPQLNVEVGAVLAPRLDLPVSLKSPDLVVGIEIGPEFSFAFVERLPGAGGLPVSVSGKVTLLLSGGIDSPVAGHLLQKRGCHLHAVYFHAPPHTSPRARDKVLRLAARLAPRQEKLIVHVVRFTELQERLRDTRPSALAVVLYRRAMMRIAGRLAKGEHSKALITGENLGQVASQTLENLACIEDASPLPILRPLVGYDKIEIINLAKHIDTYDTSISSHEDTCALFLPKHPATKARIDRVRAAEETVDDADLINAAVATAERVVI